MKKLRLTLFCMLSVFALALSGNAVAYNDAITHTDYQITGTEPTIDGTYGTPATGDTAEWAISQHETFGTNGIWRDEWIAGGGSAYQYILVETSDATDDAGDYWQLCFDGAPLTPPDQDTAPQTDDRKIEITGHGASATVEYFAGTGTGWETATAPAAGVVEIAQSLSSSPTIDADHYILEVKILKTDYGLGMTFAQSVAYYDAHSGGDGLQQWPASATADDPSGYGFIQFATGDNPTADVPEGFGLIAIVALTAVAVVGSAVFLRKRAVPKVGTRALI